MATRQSPTTNYHQCSCGESFDSTEELMTHAREEHGLFTY
jgi:hypothetical protein